jgi:uncharacterized protein (TIGR02118 family)
MSVKIVALIKAKSGVSREEFLRHWNLDHPQYVWKLPALERYVQNPAIEHRTEWAYDGMAELWFPSVSAVAHAFSTPEADIVRDHEELFIEDIVWFLAEESEIAPV